MLRDILKIAIPVSLENIIANTGTFVITILLTQLGEVAVAVNGVANQGSFLVILFLFGLNTGGAIFLAQYWGKQDFENIKKILSLMTHFSLLIALIFFILTFFFPKVFIQIFSNDENVIQKGTPFLRIISISYFGLAIEISFRTFLRSIEKATIPMMSYVYGTIIQIVLAYGFLKGFLVIPNMGLYGIALAITISRFVIPLYQIFKAKLLKIPFTYSLKGISKRTLKTFLKYATPTTLNEISWSLGMTVYGIIFGKMGTKTYAARNILSSFENYVWTFTFGIIVAGSILIGKYIGKMEYEKAQKFGKKILLWNIFIGLLSATAILIIYYTISKNFDLEAETKRLLTYTMWIMVMGSPVKAFNGAAVVGILRAGGDAKFAFLLETFSLWIFGVPLAFLGAFVWKQPLPVVYGLTLTDEIVKSVIAYIRIRSRKWIRNVTVEQKVTSYVETVIDSETHYT
ncbi:MAG: MATE family efflux transporter [Fervidobacterium sp.]